MKKAVLARSCVFASFLFLAIGSIAHGEASTDALVLKHLVSLPSGGELNINCVGQGAPTVVFEQGLAANILTWDKVVGPISQIAQVCVYDRAGEGYSKPSHKASTADKVVDDLHNLLIASHIKEPIVLVGHSIGGLYATLYADKYPSDISGLVLVDPSFSGHQDWESSDSAKRGEEIEYQEYLNSLYTCVHVAEAGKLSEDNPACPWHFAPGRSVIEKEYLGYSYTKPFKFRAEISEFKNNHSLSPFRSEDGKEEDRSKRSFGNLPMIVLTAGNPPPIESGETEADQKLKTNLWKTGHDQLASRSSIGKSIVVPDSGHFIQSDRPDAVISAIREVIAHQMSPAAR
ncbi:alpha/beta fold hydrolase [Caulobacter sp. S45]|uniref:alpha/beta fold hydrolase n=1 Tax=Caulobacter sp. S45 TaxID=1641861 RepID=UPI00131E5692|nr:alpha/beta hydrolase [Caulobacter sp. S45]